MNSQYETDFKTLFQMQTAVGQCSKTVFSDKCQGNLKELINVRLDLEIII